MTDTADTIRNNAAAINALKQRITETLKHRSSSSSGREAWVHACAEFHRQFPDLAFPGGSARWEAFLARDSSEIESAITFLEVDPKFFRSGYLKQVIWRRLKQTTLVRGQQLRLEGVALSYLNRRVCREFWEMVRYVRSCGSNEFWREVNSLASDHHQARWLLFAYQNHPVRNWINRELLRAEYQVGYKPDLSLSSWITMK